MADPRGRQRTVIRLSVTFGVLAAIFLLQFPGAPTVASDTGDYWHVCAGRGIPGATEYRPRAGRSPIVVFDMVRSGNDGWLGSEVTVSGLDRGSWSPAAPEEVQLVACAERVATGGHVTSCTIEPERKLHRRILPLRSATIEVVVRAARTGEPVGEPVLVNAIACPLKARRGKNAPREVFGGLTDQQYRDLLRPFVEG